MTGRTQREQTQGTKGTSHVSEKDDTYNGKDEGAMVACDNEHCPHMVNGTVVLNAGMQR